MSKGFGLVALATLRDPLTWSVALIFTSVEILSLYPEAFPQDVGFAFLGVDLFSEICSILFYIAGFLIAGHLRSLWSKPGAAVVMGVAGAVGIALLLAEDGEAASVLALGGMVLVQLSFVALMLMMLNRLGRQSLLRICRVVVGSGVLNGGLIALSEPAPAALGAAFIVAGAVSVAIEVRTARSENEEVLVGRARRNLRFPVILALGLIVVSASFSFLQSLLYQQPEDVVIAVVVTTKLAATIVFAGVLMWLSDTSYATLAKVIITLAAGAFLVFLAQGSYSAAPSALMATGYSLLELTSLLLLADLASYARWNPIRLFCAYYLIETAGYVVGILLLGQALAFGSPVIRLVAAAISLLLLVCAVWVFNDKRVNDFTWGAGPEAGPAPGGGRRTEPEVAFGGTEDEGSHAEGEEGVVAGADRPAPTEPPELPFAAKVALLAEHYRLTERETEVLELFAAGRSAAFISELQFVTINTVRSHIKHIYGKCDVHSRQELITLIEQQAR